jgi:hypothetical protein
MAALLLTILLGAPASAETFLQSAQRATDTLTRVFYAGNGSWRACDRAPCKLVQGDWGADAAVYTLYLRWATARDWGVAHIASDLVRTATRYPAPCIALPCSSWSDVPAWDAIALVREYQMTGNRYALLLAKRAFSFVDNARVFRLGACPDIPYQLPGGRKGYDLKTLETGSNHIKAALLLYGVTRSRAYLSVALRDYAAARRRFLDAHVPLYSVYVFDDGSRCAQLPRRFFASVNGNMIWNGMKLTEFTGSRAYLAQATASARAVATYLGDGRGIYAGLQAENDVEEPLVEAMYALAVERHESFARDWILRNARAAAGARTANGAFGRFFDGPPPRAPVSLWQTSGGLALQIAAAALDSSGAAHRARRWTHAHFAACRVQTLPSKMTFWASGIALLGTLGERCCERGRARVLIDGTETYDHTGIWQNKSMTGRVPNSVLFAWRWPHAGLHTIAFQPGVPNPKEGGPFLDVRGCVME